MRRLLISLAVLATAGGSASAATAQELAFVSERDGNAEVYAMAADGSGQQRNLSSNAEPDEGPAWSPDGGRIAFSRGFGGEAEIWVMNADGSDQRRLTQSDGPDRLPDWSPDGRRIVFVSERSGGPELHVMNADGSGVSQLTSTEGVAAGPAWSPDGTRIAYWREDVAQIRVISADGATDVAVGGGDVADRDPAWSPDGARLAFTTLRDMGRDLDVFAMAADGSAQAPVAASTARETDVAWALDGRMAFATDRDGDLELWSAATDGSDARRLTSSARDDYAPDWRPPPPSFSGALPPAGGSIVVGAPDARPGSGPAARRRTQPSGRVTLTMRSSSVAITGRQLRVTLRFSLSAPARGTFRVFHRGKVVMRKRHLGRRGVNVVVLKRRIADRARWTGTYRLSVVDFARR